jgi:hypothetical protein
VAGPDKERLGKARYGRQGTACWSAAMLASVRLGETRQAGQR